MRDSMGFRGFGGIPWIRWDSVDSVGFCGFGGILWIRPFDSVGFRLIPWDSMGFRWILCDSTDSG